MFMPTLLNQGTEEQKKLYLEPAKRYEIIGCYAQTEVSTYKEYLVKRLLYIIF
jgi:alkylation response protein AidB-like acyl-CoA dehydrogenase